MGESYSCLPCQAPKLILIIWFFYLSRSLFRADGSIFLVWKNPIWGPVRRWERYFCQAWWSKFNSHNLHSRRKEPTPAKLSSDLHMPVAHVPHPQMHTINKSGVGIKTLLQAEVTLIRFSSGGPKETISVRKMGSVVGWKRKNYLWGAFPHSCSLFSIVNHCAPWDS